jgi:protease I
MNSRRKIFPWLMGCLAVFWLASLGPSAQAGPTPDEAGRAAALPAIEEAVRDCLEGGTQGDLERLRRAFHPGAELKFTKDGDCVVWSLDEYLNRLGPGRRSDRRTRIEFVDFAGNCAVVKAEIEYPRFRFIDYLCLLEIEGEWRIVSKIFCRLEK